MGVAEDTQEKGEGKGDKKGDKKKVKEIEIQESLSA